MFNKVILVGNLTRDIELRYTQSSMAIGKTGIATNRSYKTQTGEQKDEVMFIDITFFNRAAEIANQYLRKGSKVLVEGRLVYEQWVDQNGQKRNRHSVTVETMKMLDGRNDAPSFSDPNEDAYMPEPSYAPSYPDNNYNRPQQPMQQRQPAPQPKQQPNREQEYTQNIPVIDIDDDEIPF